MPLAPFARPCSTDNGLQHHAAFVLIVQPDLAIGLRRGTHEDVCGVNGARSAFPIRYLRGQSFQFTFQASNRAIPFLIFNSPCAFT
jgi:hypothetical protein